MPREIDKLMPDENSRYQKETVYTQAELNEAVRVEREACALECEALDLDFNCGVSENYQCAEAIKARNKS